MAAVCECRTHGSYMQSCIQLYLLQYRILDGLQWLDFTPTQQHLDELSQFLQPVQATSLVETAGKARLMAKLQHQVDWVQQHMDAESDLCLRAGFIGAR